MTAAGWAWLAGSKKRLGRGTKEGDQKAHQQSTVSPELTTHQRREEGQTADLQLGGDQPPHTVFGR